MRPQIGKKNSESQKEGINLPKEVYWKEHINEKTSNLENTVFTCD